MYCVFCGKYNFAEARFCYSCGKFLENQRNADVKPAAAPETPVLPTYAPPAATSNYTGYPASNPPAPYYSYPQTTPNPYPGYNLNPYTYAPSPIADDTQLSKYHPLLQGAVGLPTELYLKPTTYYSYVTPGNRVAVVKRGSFWQRVGAMLLDLLILLLPNLILFSVYSGLNYRGSSSQLSTPPWWLYAAFYLLNFGYFWFGGIQGRSIGKRATRLRIIRLDGSKPNWFTAFLRQFCGYLLSASPALLALIIVSLVGAVLPINRTSARASTIIGSLVLLGLTLVGAGGVIGYAWAGWDKQKQAWHDKLARTLVVEDVVWIEGQNFGLPPHS